MLFMNEHEVRDAAWRYADHPTLGPATETLINLVEWTNSHSDGWAYWPKPCRAAAKLQTLIGGLAPYYEDPSRSDVVPEQLAAALRPIKAFRTRHGADFDIIEAR